MLCYCRELPPREAPAHMQDGARGKHGRRPAARSPGGDLAFLRRLPPAATRGGLCGARALFSSFDLRRSFLVRQVE